MVFACGPEELCGELCIDMQQKALTGYESVAAVVRTEPRWWMVDGVLPAELQSSYSRLTLFKCCCGIMFIIICVTYIAWDRSVCQINNSVFNKQKGSGCTTLQNAVAVVIE